MAYRTARVSDSQEILALVDSLLSDLCQEASRRVRQDLALWAFLYDSSADVLSHWHLVHPSDPSLAGNHLVKSVSMPGNRGTVGYIVQSREPEIIDDTLDDPRGMAAAADYVINNHAWCGVPMLSGDHVLGVISFFPLSKAWIPLRPKRDILEVLERLVTRNSSLLTTLAQLQLEHISNDIVRKGFDVEGLDFARTLEVLLHKVRSLALSRCAFRDIICLKAKAGDLTLASLVRNYQRDEADVLAQLEWESICFRDETKVLLEFMGGRLKALLIPVDDVFEVSILHSAGTEAAQATLATVFRAFAEAMTKTLGFFMSPEGRILLTLKECEEISALIFSIGFSALVKPSQGETTSVTDDLLDAVNTYLVSKLAAQEARSDNEQIELKDRWREDFGRVVGFLRSMDVAGNVHEIVRELCVGGVLWIKLQSWGLVEGDAEDGVRQYVRDPGTWRVLRKAAESKGRENKVLQKYKTPQGARLGGGAIRFKKRSRDGRAVTFDLGNLQSIDLRQGIIRYPIAVRFNVSAYDGLSSQKSGSRGRFFRAGDDVVMQESNRYTILTETDDFIVAIDSSATMVAGDLSDLKDYCDQAARFIELQERKRQASEALRRSGVAAVMARNMSHNIGSHVLYHVTRESYDQRLTSTLLAYLQRRMDYIAHIATSSPSWAVPMRWFEDIAKPFENQKLLLNKIGYSYGYGGDLLTVEFQPRCEGIWIEVPHGHLGIQAFYTILENVIRNAAKYGRGAEKLDLQITLHYNEAGTEDTNYYDVRITDNRLTDSSKLVEIEKHLAAKVFDDVAGLSQGQWGFKEMKLSATYLLGVSPLQVDKCAEILKATLDGESLKYFLKIRRPRRAIVVGYSCPAGLEFESAEAGFKFLNDLNELYALVRSSGLLTYDFLYVSDCSDYRGLARLFGDCRNLLPRRVILHGRDAAMKLAAEYWCALTSQAFVPGAGRFGGFLTFLWNIWAEHMWPNNETIVRVDDPSQEVAVDTHLLDESKDLGCPYSIVFDHREDPETTDLFQQAGAHYAFSQSGNDPIWSFIVAENRWAVREMGALSVIVIDERVAGEKNRVEQTAKSNSITLNELWIRQRTWVIHPDDLKAGDATFAELLTITKRLGGCRIDALVVHEGALERLSSDAPHNYKQMWSDLKGCFNFVVLTTGRGKSTIASNEKLPWVEFSNLADCLLQNPTDKPRLARLLLSLRASFES